jgi:hypothetical protein
MAILLDNLNILTWLWHDANVLSLNISWAEDGAVSVHLRCKISPEEDRQPLLELGINTSIVDTNFHDVFQLKTDIQGYYFPREAVIDWRVIQPSPLIEHLKSIYPEGVDELYHHQIQCSGGTILDVVFGEVWLDEVT